MIAEGVLERLTVQINADLDGLNASVAPLGRAVDQMSSEVTRKTSKIGQAFSSLGPMISGFVGGIVAGLGVEAVQAVGNFAQSTLNAADDIGDLAQRLGESTEGVQRLQVAFQQAGAAPGLMQEAMDKLNVGVGAFIQTGGGPAKAALESLGLASKVASGELRGAENIFYAAATALEGVSDPAERARISMQLFGRAAGTDMIEVLGAGGDALRQFGIDAQESGRIMSDDMVQGLADARQEIEIAKQQFGQLATVGIGKAIIAAKDLIDSFKAVFSASQGELSPEMQKLRERFAPLMKAVQDAGEAFRNLAQGPIGQVVIPALGRLAVFIGEQLVGAITGAITFIGRIAGALDGAARGFGEWVVSVRRFVSEAIATIQGLPAAFLQVGRDLVAGLINGITQRVNDAINAVRGLGDRVIAAANEVFRRNSPSKEFIDIGEDLSRGLAIGIRNRSAEAVAAMTDLSNRVTGLWRELLTESEAAALELSNQHNLIREAIQAGPSRGGVSAETGATLFDRLYGRQGQREVDKAMERVKDFEVDTGEGIRISNPTINTDSLDELARAIDRAGWNQGRQMVLGVQRGIQETAPSAIGEFQGFANDLANVLGALSGKTQASVSDIIMSLSRLAATAFPQMFGTGTRGGGILSAIGSIVGAFTGSGNLMGAVSGGGGFNGGFGGGRMTPANTNVRVFIGNEAIDNRMVSIATGVSAQAFSAARSQIPVDMTRAQRGTMWG